MKSNQLPQIPDNADLNTYTTPGAYVVRNYAVTRTLKNGPDVAAIGSGYRLFVMQTTNTDASGVFPLVQIAVVTDSIPKLYMRSNWSGTFNEWQNFVSTGIIKKHTQRCKDVAITTKSGDGAYYNTKAAMTLSEVMTKNLISIAVGEWGGCTASVTPYLSGNDIGFMSDVSQTAAYIDVIVTYI